MLAETDKKVLKGLLPEMATIVNLIPGEVFTCKDADALLILQRRLPDSDLKNELVLFNEIFVKQKGANILDITNSYTAFVNIKVLLESDSDCFDGHSYRALFKECKNQVVRTNNIVRLTNTSALTADDYQKDKIDLVLRKNSSFLAALSNLMDSVEKRLERYPTDEVMEKDEKELDEEVCPTTPCLKEKRKSFVELIIEFKKERDSKKEKDEFLKAEEEKKAQTYCKEIPFYDRSLVFTEHMVCRDIPQFSILKKKSNVYFGHTRNISHGYYDNTDESLWELTKASDEFIQFMTENLLSDEFELKAFTSQDKQGMQMYFNFMNKCFETYIGVVLTVREYLDFKGYYNNLVIKMFALEKQQKEEYYQALALAEKYLECMKIYCLDCADSKEDVITNILSEDVINYLADVDMILKNHIVVDEARTQLMELQQSMEHFRKEEKQADIVVVEKEAEEIVSTPPLVQIPMFQAIQPQYVQQNMMQIVVQILDDKHEVLDEALYAGDNIRQALLDYERKDAYIKRLGFRNNGVDVFYKEEVNQ